MKNNTFFKAETKTVNFMGKLFNPINLKAEEIKEEVKEVEVIEKKTPTINYEDLIAKARKEEKDKVYGQLEKKDSKISELTEKNNNLMLKVGEQEATIKALNNEIDSLRNEGKVGESETVKSLNKENEKLKKKIEDIEKSQVNIQEIENRIKEEYEVKMYRMEKLSEHGNNVIPELVVGLTKEEIDQSLELSIARYNDIIGKVAPTQEVQSPKVNIPTGNPTSKTVSTLSPEDIVNMSPSDWAEYRKTLGLK